MVIKGELQTLNLGGEKKEKLTPNILYTWQKQGSLLYVV